MAAGRLSQAVAATAFAYGAHGLSALLFTPDALAPATRIITIYIGGLGDGLLGVPFLPSLRDALGERGVPLVQPILRSSYRQYGFSTLAQDVEDLDDLVADLHAAQGGSARFLLIGHSTGCQDSVTYAKTGRHRGLLAALVLQAAVSDRDYFLSIPREVEKLAAAEELRTRGELDAIVPRKSADENPLSARRALAFMSRLGDDDLFTNDLTDTELQTLYAGVAVPTRWVFSLNDEYVRLPADVYAALTERLPRQMPPSVPHGHSSILVPGNHALLDSTEGQTRFVNAVAAFADALLL